jgi:hypothetical protein
MNVITEEAVCGIYSSNTNPMSNTQIALTVSTLAIYIVPGTLAAIHLSSSVDFSSSFNIVFAATEGVAVSAD